MFNKIRNRKNNKKGFTLIELIIVIAILGILAAILVPSMLNIVNNASDQVNESNARALYSIAQSANVKLTVEGTPPGDDTYTSAADGATAIMTEIAANLGAGFDAAYTVTVTGGTVTSVTYDSVAWTP